MQYYSTNNSENIKTLKEAVIEGLADDKGLFMPSKIKQLSSDFFENIDKLSFQEIAFEVANAFFGEDIEEDKLRNIVYDTLQFDCPIVEVESNIFSLELFHGPTLAFKDVGGRFMARMLAHFVDSQKQNINVLVATSGDTGSAVANGFYNVDGVQVYVLYPKGLVSKIQEMQFTTLGNNICAIEVDGTFDDCQAIVKSAFLDTELNNKLALTSANSINVARFLPQAFYYFYAYAQLKKQGADLSKLVFSVPSGNFGNLTAGLFAQQMGLKVERFIAANNENDVVYKYLKTGNYSPTKSIATIANAMDVGAPSNFDRILNLFNSSHSEITKHMVGYKYSDNQIKDCILSTYKNTGYILDPHGACGYMALKDDLKKDEVGVFLETAHPAKFKETVDSVLMSHENTSVEIPERLAEFMKGDKQSIEISSNFEDFKAFLFSKSI